MVAKQSLKSIAGVKSCELSGHAQEGWQEWDVQLEPGVPAGTVLEACTEKSIPLRRFDERRASLHDVFLQVVGPAEARP